MLPKIVAVTMDPGVRARALKLADLETDPKYRKKYLTAWRGTAS